MINRNEFHTTATSGVVNLSNRYAHLKLGSKMATVSWSSPEPLSSNEIAERKLNATVFLKTPQNKPNTSKLYVKH